MSAPHDPTEFPSTLAQAAPSPTGELKQFAQYRILKQLGAGGMGIVYQAEDTQLRRMAALKVMRPDAAADRDGRERFLREARAAAQLKHDHVVTIYQVGEEASVPFLAMEFLAGKSLEAWLRPDRRATVAETLLIGKQIAKGLAAAHAAGLIHRDIKPANIWLEAPRGRVKILDFGLARRVGGELESLTQDGSVLGTPAFMAPEQARGETVDHRCDLFSLGCVLFRMLTGRLPFQGNTTYAVLTAIASETPPRVSALRPEVPDRLALLVEQLLKKQADARPASAQVVLDELAATERESKQRVAEQPAIAAGEEKHQSRSWTPWAVGALTLLLLAVALLPLLNQQSKQPAAAIPSASSPAEKGDETQPGVAATTPAEAREPVDLLAILKLPEGFHDGAWVRAPEPPHTVTVYPFGDPRFVAVIPWKPPSEYRIRMKCRRLSKEGAIALGLGSGEHRFSVVVDFKPEKGPLRSGIGHIRGKHLSERKGGRAGPLIPQDFPVTLVATVRKDRVLLELNGAVVEDWSGDLAHLTRPPEFDRSPLLLLGSGSYLFEEILLEHLGEAR